MRPEVRVTACGVTTPDTPVMRKVPTVALAPEKVKLPGGPPPGLTRGNVIVMPPPKSRRNPPPRAAWSAIDWNAAGPVRWVVTDTWADARAPVASVAVTEYVTTAFSAGARMRVDALPWDATGAAGPLVWDHW